MSAKRYDTYCKTYMPKEGRKGTVYRFDKASGGMVAIDRTAVRRRNTDATSPSADNFPAHAESMSGPCDPDYVPKCYR